MSFKGEIKWSGLISNYDGAEFYSQVKKTINTDCVGLYTEIQYQPLMQIEGKMLLTAFIIGREPKTLE